MIHIENVETYGWEAAVRGMRNPMNSWGKIDSFMSPGDGCYVFVAGKSDLKLMQQLVAAGPDHAKFLRMIGISMDIKAPLYWWKEFDTYKVGTVANSCSTMHKIAEKDLTLADFSTEHLNENSLNALKIVIAELHNARTHFLLTNDKKWWWQMIQLLPSSYEQKRTVTLNYEVARRQYHARNNHKLDEWREGYCKVLEQLPYAKELIMS